MAKDKDHDYEIGYYMNLADEAFSQFQSNKNGRVFEDIHLEVKLVYWLY